jgi:peptide/nickel transport system ATP-binding protein
MLKVENLSAWYGPSEVLRDVSLAVAAGECAAIVGESGSGKTTLARCIAGLHRDLEGRLSLAGSPLAAGARARTPELRRAVQYVFQNPYASLNPRRTIGESIVQPLRHFDRLSRNEADDRIRAALETVALRPSLIDRYPHQLSGGERQRVAIARALALSPKLLICDEVTSSLDVSVQAVIIQLLAQLQRERGLTMLFVTHNLALVRTIARTVAVMSAGTIVESGLVDEVLAEPKAAETQRLVRDIPRFDPARFSLPA